MKVELKRSTPNLELVIAEEAGICYDSDVSNPKQLLKRLKKDGHFATFRFAHATFQISDFSRTCSMQMLRHKFLDFLQRSQRYCKEFQFEYVVPPSIEKDARAEGIFIAQMMDIQKVYDKLIELKVKAEDARYVLPNACYTKMNVTGSIQAWWEFLHGNAGRLQPAAQWEIREIAIDIERQLHEVAPNIFNGKGIYRDYDR